MMRTVEVLIVIAIIFGAFIAVSAFAVLPTPKQVSPISLNKLASTTLQELNTNYDLSAASFSNSTSVWGPIQVALSASLPPNVIYNMTVYNVTTSPTGVTLYNSAYSISNAQSLGSTSDASNYLVASTNITYNITPQKIGANGGTQTVYILNCSDAPGWWITGYTANSLAQDLVAMLSQYFNQTVVVQNTAQLGQILNGTSLQGETLQNAVIINTDGEAVPIPSGYYSTTGYDSGNNSYANYAYILGQRVLQYNWTWASIVGYPQYYVSNTALFPNSQNTWGIFGMQLVGSAGLNAFLEGLDNQTYSYNSTWITDSPPGVVYMSSPTVVNTNYYGIYASTYQTSTRALPTYITSMYHLNVTTYVFNTVADGNGNWNPGAIYRHNANINGVTSYQGGFFALGMTRIPDIRLTALGILSDYQPRLYGSDSNSAGSSRLVVLQLGLAGSG
jgi:hypothetical protein